MMLIFLTFGMLVFLHDFWLVSISLGDYLTWILKNGHVPQDIDRMMYRERMKNPIPVLKEWDQIG